MSPEVGGRRGEGEEGRGGGEGRGRRGGEEERGGGGGEGRDRGEGRRGEGQRRGEERGEKGNGGEEMGRGRGWGGRECGGGGRRKETVISVTLSMKVTLPHFRLDQRSRHQITCWRFPRDPLSLPSHPTDPSASSHLRRVPGSPAACC